MASSGWLGEQFIVRRSSNISYYGNLYISSITRSGTNVTVSGKIRFTAKGTSGYSSYYNYGVQADPAGSQGFITILGNNVSISNGSNKDVGFSTTVSNVAATATSMSFGVRYVAWLNSGHTSSYWDVTKNWTIYFESGGTAPSGLSATISSYTDTSATINVSIASYGTPASSGGRYIEAAVFTGTTYGGTYRYKKSYHNTYETLTVDNMSEGSLVITPNTQYHYGCYANNTSLSANVVAPDTFVTLPAYITGITAIHTGGGVMNIATQHASEGSALTVYTEYSWDGVTWTTVSDPFNVTITGPKTIYVRRFSDSGKTPVYRATITPSNGAQLYGSVSGLSKNLSPLYASFGNYFDGHRYLARTDRSVEISGDDVTVTKVSSGSGGWQWVAFPIDATDEIINKQVTITGEMYTSSPENSMIDLYWLNTAGTNYVSQVSGFQFTGHADRFTITGTIPSRPSNAGNLCIMLYSNKESQPQGTYTIFRNVELKANVKNIFNYIGVKSSVGGLTPSQSADGTITVTGTLSSNYQHITSTDRNITNILEDGVKYTISAANTYTPDLAIEIRAKKTGESAYSYWNTRGQQTSTFTVDKTTYEKYEVYAITSTTASWGTASKTVSNKFQLEKGASATSFAPFVDTKSHKLKKVYGSVNGRSKLIYQE